MSNEMPAIAVADSQPKAGWRRAFGLDVRSLASMRIGLGLVLLLNLCDLAPDIGAFYSDDGLLPRAARTQMTANEEGDAPAYWCSLQMLSGAVWYQNLLAGMGMVLAACVAVGYRTSWALFGSWVLLVGFQARNPMILIGGDIVLRCLLFWCLFLPLGARWSLDARRTTTPSPRTLGSPATAILILQLACIYFSTGLLKSDAAWRSDFSAVYLALGSDHHTSRFGLLFLDYPRLLEVLTFATLALEIFGAVVLFLPSERIRLALVFSFWGLHLGILTTMDVGLFSPICMVYWLALLPGSFWDSPAIRRAATRFRRRSAPVAIGPPPRTELEAATNPHISEGRPSLFINSLIVVLASYVVLINLLRISTQDGTARLSPSPIQVLGDAAQLNQYWCMFSPRPADFGGWFNARGTLTNGERVNLWQPELPVQESRPEVVSEGYPNMRWRKIMVNQIERDCPIHIRELDAFLRRRWNDNHAADRQVAEVEMILVRQPTLPANRGVSRGALEYEVLWRSTQTTPPQLHDAR